MRLLRVFLLLCMGLIVLMMAGCPGLYDSKRRVTAHRHYYDAPNEETKRELENAKRLDRRDIIVFETVMLGIFGVSVFAFVRIDKCVHAPATRPAGQSNGPV